MNQWLRIWRRLCLASSLLSFGLLTGCADTGYWLQSLQGHWQVMRSAKPVADWLQDPQTSTALRERLQLAQRMREFAVSELHLPDNASYHRYADLNRRFVVWNVVAAPPDSLQAKTWCFPVAGCVSYRGFYNPDQPEAEAQTLREQGWEVVVYGVPAYSTLGWSNALGGDPLLNTFINYAEGDLARLIFHELAHQVLYVKDDTTFNESFAVSVERLGGQRWLVAHASTDVRADDAQLLARRQQFQALTRTTGQRLANLYSQREQLGSDWLEAKRQIMQAFRVDYAQLKDQWGGYAGYDDWVARANNAAFAAVSAYDELVPGFEALFERNGHDWNKFYDAVRQLAKLSPEQRRQALKLKNGDA